MFQNYATISTWTCITTWHLDSNFAVQPKVEIERRVHEAAKILDIEDLLKRKLKQLSGGQRKRVALGRVIVREPKVFLILMDDPLSNLDAKLRVQMRTEIAKLHKRLKANIIYVTHDQTEAVTMADRIIIMKDGLVQQIGVPQDVYDNLGNMFVAGFIGSSAMNFLDAVVTEDMVIKNDNVSLQTTDMIKEIIKDNGLIGKEIVMGIRPEDLEDSAFVESVRPGNMLTANVEVTEPMGSEIYTYISINGVLITARVNPRSKVTDGKDITLYVDLEKIYLFDKETEKAYI